ncbi:hypothetical protein FXO37_26892 [Capsicum annuum]|nr:hypothetical protein FXO37_26892 [Capsicum annuum]
METPLKNLREKEKEYNDLEALKHTLIVKERNSKEGLQDTQKELVNSLKEPPRVGQIGVNGMRELDNRPFHKVMKRNYDESEVDERPMELMLIMGGIP